MEGISCPNGRIDPKGKQWIITWQRGSCSGENWEWTCHTDTPIILFAYVGTHPPWKRKGSHVKRGVVTHHDPTVYFPYDFITCQNEEGEVTEHTFTWPAYPNEEVFWWRCGGRTGGFFPKWSASRSPFWNAKCAAAEYECSLRYSADPQMIRLIKGEPGGSSTPSDNLWKTNPADASYKGSIFGNFYFRWPNWSIYRILARWDTAAIPLDATIVSAYIRAKVKVPSGSNVPALFVTMPTVDPWTNAEAVGHWIDPVIGGQIVAEVPNNYDVYTWLDIPLNQIGLDHINKGGWTHFAWITQNDYQRASVPVGMIYQQHAYLSSSYNHCRLYVTYVSEEPCPE